jgi:hypothetical protein
LDTLNPYTADTVPDWQCLTNPLDGFYGRNPYTLEYIWTAVEGMPTIEEWVGPGGSWLYETDQQGYAATYGNETIPDPFNGTHYNGIPVADVTTADMIGDDVVGMVTTWKFREDIFWQDSVNGSHPITNADIEFCLNLLRYQEVDRYMTNWQFIVGVEPIGNYTFKIYEERRYLFAFEAHGLLLGPKTLWEDFIHDETSSAVHTYPDGLNLTRPDGSTGYADYWDYSGPIPLPEDSPYDGHHEEWRGWEEIYMEDPANPGEQLTYLIGFGSHTYHFGGWEEGVSVKLDRNPVYYMGHICPGDVDFNLRVEPVTEDTNAILRSIGPYGAANYLIKCDIAYPAQLVDLHDIEAMEDHSGHYWGPDPVPDGFDRCPDEP